MRDAVVRELAGPVANALEVGQNLGFEGHAGVMLSNTPPDAPQPLSKRPTIWQSDGGCQNVVARESVVMTPEVMTINWIHGFCKIPHDLSTLAITSNRTSIEFLMNREIFSIEDDCPKSGVKSPQLEIILIMCKRGS